PRRAARHLPGFAGRFHPRRPGAGGQSWPDPLGRGRVAEAPAAGRRRAARRDEDRDRRGPDATAPTAPRRGHRGPVARRLAADRGGARALPADGTAPAAFFGSERRVVSAFTRTFAKVPCPTGTVSRAKTVGPGSGLVYSLMETRACIW